MKKISILSVFIMQTMLLSAKDYPASLFGIRNDGVTLNTRSIQFAIDYISQQGGGRLVFHVGRYLTGSLHLKSNITLQLEEGAVLVGSLNPFDYDKTWATALLHAQDIHDFAITGKGIIDGQGRALAVNVTANIHKGLVKDLFRNDRPEAESRAMIIYFKSCRNVLLRGVTIRNSASWVETYDQCTNLTLDSIYVDSKAFWNNDGIDIVDCDSVRVTNSYIDSDDDGICLKSHDASRFCNNVYIYNNTVRSSANAIKFGTASYGGFKNVTIIKNRVFDTYRSAIALEAVDGGFVSDILVDSLQCYNTGNFLYLRTGERWAKGKKGSMNNVVVRNVYAEIPAGKPDVGYEYEGPIEDMPRNVTPAIVITGIPGANIKGVVLENVEVKFPGGGNTMFAKVGLDELDKIPERPAAYPDFSMFQELPAWGAYIRHAEGINFKSVKMVCEKKDYRPAIVLDDVHRSQFGGAKITEPAGGAKKQPVFQHKSSEISVK